MGSTVFVRTISGFRCDGRGGQGNCSNACVLEWRVHYNVRGAEAAKSRLLCCRCAVLSLARRVEDNGRLCLEGGEREVLQQAIVGDDVSGDHLPIFVRVALQRSQPAEAKGGGLGVFSAEVKADHVGDRRSFTMRTDDRETAELRRIEFENLAMQLGTLEAAHRQLVPTWPLVMYRRERGRPRQAVFRESRSPAA